MYAVKAFLIAFQAKEMSLQSLMKQDFGDDDSDSPDEDFDPIGDADSGDEDDLPATIEAQACWLLFYSHAIDTHSLTVSQFQQYAQNLSQLCSDGDEELLAKLLAEMTQTPSENKAVSAEGDAPAAGIDAEPDLNIDHLNQDGCTALFTAICHQQLGCCKQLLAAGAKTNVLHEGSSYLHAAMVLSSHAVKASVLRSSESMCAATLSPQCRKIVHFPFLWPRFFLHEVLLLQFVMAMAARASMPPFLVAFCRVSA